MSFKIGLRAVVSLVLWALAAVFVQFVPNSEETPTGSLFIFILAVIAVLLVSFLLLSTNPEKHQKRQALADVTSVFAVVLIAWEAMTAKWRVVDAFIFPSPGTVFDNLWSDRVELLGHIAASTKLLITGFGLALILGVFLGLLAGSNQRVQDLVKSLANIASPIPPIVYIPYAITILPSFFMSSVFVIFLGAFWPILINTINGVGQIEHRLIDSARTLQLSPWTLFRRVLFPGALPGIFSGATVGLVFAFILLTAAELIGGTAGLGYYVKYFTDFGDYSRVVVGIIVIGFYVTILMTLMQRIERYCLRWKQR